MAKSRTRDALPSGRKGTAGEKAGFARGTSHALLARGTSHALLARVATSRWSRVVGYGALIFACRMVRTLIRA